MEKSKKILTSTIVAGVLVMQGASGTTQLGKKAYPNLIHYNKLDKGGHFPAWEQPELFVNEIRAAFSSLRGSVGK
ncbi:MAG TPA: alpha/beta hydrolase [Mucilaginibacter sp.]|nr:alpha/beta hydrolase [Mucilaginibacter sp.]